MLKQKSSYKTVSKVARNNKASSVNNFRINKKFYNSEYSVKEPLVGEVIDRN